MAIAVALLLHSVWAMRLPDMAMYLWGCVVIVFLIVIERRERDEQ